ncbi:hypothetical protein BP6252_06704 [Coleophoma cylindrospora]|uniref:3-beta hydroxysteroid dehydrogenase/isomerase domain-containing protein n=1 Tax=Coleophoma cylindrospora TaxID=1849047 RepID=A0A3D8RFH7_9HELO|nr:hypothetical protein BP6252_06704 [Coleophoma cylindrospora]
MSGPKTAIPKGSWVLVTGATGFVASHTIKSFLERGFKVRGTVRDVRSAAWLTEDIFKSFADRGDLELAHVPELGAKHAFDEAVKEVSAIAHIASILSFSDDPNEVIRPVVDGVTSILEAASNEASVKSFVYTSSIAAAVDLTPGVTAHAGPEAWNDKAVELAWAPPPHAHDHWHWVYQASKVEAEKSVWAFVEKNKPHFAVNVISPATILGEALTKKHVVSPYPWIKNLYDGKEEIEALFQAIIHIDVKDVALLHVAALLDTECDGARLQAWAEYCNMNDILAILRRLCPQKTFMDDFPNQKRLTITADYDQQLALLKKWGGQDGWTSLEQTVADGLKSMMKWYPEY